MPLPNFHAARTKSPESFDKIVVLKKLPNGIMIYGGKLKTDTAGDSKPQSYRFPKAKFTIQQAKSWLSENNIKIILFEPAEGDNPTEKKAKDTKDDKGKGADKDIKESKSIHLEESSNGLKDIFEDGIDSEANFNILTNLSESKVDPENMIIRDVVVLSKVSYDTAGKVRRRYTDNALKSAISVFEGAPAYINHDKKRSRSIDGRGINGMYGAYKGLRDVGNKVKADLHCFDCAESRKIMSIAMTAPDVAGNSIHAAGRGRIESGVEVIEEILPRTKWGHKPSIDMVRDPATTMNIFEDSLLDDNSDNNNNNRRSKTMNYKDIEINEMKLRRPDIVSMFQDEGAVSRDDEIKTLTEERDTLKTENDKLKGKVDVFEAKANMSEKTELVNRLIDEVKLPKEVITDLFKSQLMQVEEAKDGDKVITVEEQIKSLLADRKAIAGNKGVRNMGSHQTEITNLNENKGNDTIDINDDKTFVNALRRR